MTHFAHDAIWGWLAYPGVKNTLTSQGISLIYFSNLYTRSLEAADDGLIPMLQDMVQAERLLIRRYDEMLEKLDA